ncbi:MAG: EsaB/YukD family protein [Clostridium sp.]|nr:EsaB/YukD family protein [Clostridium sp.]
MIIVDVRVPALEKQYNLSLEEKAKVGDLIEEIVELILQKEHIGFRGDINSLVLSSIDKGVQMRRDRTLSDYGVRGGDELLLV